MILSITSVDLITKQKKTTKVFNLFYIISDFTITTMKKSRIYIRVLCVLRKVKMNVYKKKHDSAKAKKFMRMNKTSGTNSSPRPMGEKRGHLQGLRGDSLVQTRMNILDSLIIKLNYLECMLGILTLSRERFGRLS